LKCIIANLIHWSSLIASLSADCGQKNQADVVAKKHYHSTSCTDKDDWSNAAVKISNSSITQYNVGFRKTTRTFTLNKTAAILSTLCISAGAMSGALVSCD